MPLLDTPTTIGDTVFMTANADYLQGEMVLVDELVGVALHDALTGQQIQLGMHGVFDLPKGNDTATAGQKCFYVSKTRASTDTGSTIIGCCIKNAALSDPTIRVYFTGFMPL